jgi:hypothetical protein
MQGNGGKKTLITAENDILSRYYLRADDFSSEKGIKTGHVRILSYS